MNYLFLNNFYCLKEEKQVKKISSQWANFYSKNNSVILRMKIIFLEKPYK